MSIASEISRLQTSKADVKAQVNADKDLINSGTAFIDDETLDEYSEKIEEMQEAYKKYIPIQTTSGTEIQLDNSSNDKALVNIGLEGNTEQFTTTGKNLMPTKTFTSTTSERIIGDSTTISGIPVTANQQYTASFDVTTLPSSDYRVQIIVSSDSTQNQASTDPVNILSKEAVTANSLTRFSVSITPSANAYIYLRCVPAGFKLDNIQLEKGTATTYEKYTGRNRFT